MKYKKQRNIYPWGSLELTTVADLIELCFRESFLPCVVVLAPPNVCTPILCVYISFLYFPSHRSWNAGTMTRFIQTRRSLCLHKELPIQNISQTCEGTFAYQKVKVDFVVNFTLVCYRFATVQGTRINLALGFFPLGSSGKLRLCGISRVKCWKLSNVSANIPVAIFYSCLYKTLKKCTTNTFTLKMANALCVEKFDNFRHSTPVIPKSWSFIFTIKVS